MFGAKLKELRKSKGYSMDNLIELYNKRFNGHLNKSTISRYENNLQIPMFTVVKNMAELFGVTTDYLSNDSILTPTENTTGTNKQTVENNIEEDVIIYHRNGKTVKKKMSKSQMDLLTSMLDAIPDDCNL